MFLISYKTHYRQVACAAAFVFPVFAGGCSSENLLRTQDRKIEELRLDRARQDDAMSRTREAVDQLRNEWLTFSARESVAAKETAAIPSAIRRLASRLDDLDGKRMKLEERVGSVDKQSAELQLAFTQAIATLKASEGDLLALRASRAAAWIPANISGGSVSAGREAPTRATGDGSAVDSTRSAAAAGSWPEGAVASPGALGQLFSALLFAMGILVALACVYLGAWIRSSANVRSSGRDSSAEKADGASRNPRTAPAATPAAASAASPARAQESTPEAEAEAEAEAEVAVSSTQEEETILALVPESELEAEQATSTVEADAEGAETSSIDEESTSGGPIFSTSAVDDFFDEAEKASVRFAGSAATLDAGSIEQASPDLDEASNDDTVKIAGEEASKTEILQVEDVEDATDTVVMAVAQGRSHARKSETGALTEAITESPGRTQVISDHVGMLPIQKPAPPPPPRLVQERPKTRSALIPLPRKAPITDEKNLLDELENLIGQKVGEREG